MVTANRSDIIDKAKEYKKIESNKLSTEKYGLKEYFSELNVQDAKLFFAIRSRMTRYIQTNYKGNAKYKSNGWKCTSCKVLDTQEHVELCPVFESLRKDRDLTVKKNLVDYYRSVIHIRQYTDV